jgi:hypothetical protein
MCYNAITYNRMLICNLILMKENRSIDTPKLKAIQIHLLHLALKSILNLCIYRMSLTCSEWFGVHFLQGITSHKVSRNCLHYKWPEVKNNCFSWVSTMFWKLTCAESFIPMLKYKRQYYYLQYRDIIILYFTVEETEVQKIWKKN